MSKIIIFDADGVTVKLREKYFSQRLSEDYGISPELVLPLFQNEFYKCTLGEADLKEVLKSYVLKWKWLGSVDELLSYWWKGEDQLNLEVIEFIKKFREQGYKCYLATDQEKYRATHLMVDVGLGKYLDGAFFSYEIGISKSKKEFWYKVLDILRPPDKLNVYFFDDEKENIDAAIEAGIQAFLFTGDDSLNHLE